MVCYSISSSIGITIFSFFINSTWDNLQPQKQRINITYKINNEEFFLIVIIYTNKDSKIVQIVKKAPLLETINSSTYKIEDLNKKMLDYLKLVYKN